MKILQLVISDSSGREIQKIDFKEFGVSYILGDIKEPKNKVATINSLGKTLLLKFVDYIFGANETPHIIKEAIHGYKLNARVLYNKKEYQVVRTLGSSKSILIDCIEYNLNEYKDFFDISRALYGKQIIINKKSSEFSEFKQPVQSDVDSCLTLLGLNELVKTVDEIYQSQDTIKSLESYKKGLVSSFGDFNEKQIKGKAFFVDQEVKELSEKIENNNQKIKSLQISDIKKSILEEYSQKSEELKNLKNLYEKKKFECERLKQFIEDSNKIDIKSKDIIITYEKAKTEIPDMVKKTLLEVEKFHKRVYEERKDFLTDKIEKIKSDMTNLNRDIVFLSEDIDNLGVIIAENEIYKESIDLLLKYNMQLQEAKYKQGALSKVTEIVGKIEEEDKKRIAFFDIAQDKRLKTEDTILEYRFFMSNSIRNLYDNDVNAFFDIFIRKAHKTTRPVNFDFSINGDAGEGIGEVKKNLIDYLICRFNNLLEIMVQDSACYSGIDPRQVNSMLTSLDNISKDTGKQIFIAINKYQLGDDEEAIKKIKDNSVIVLFENINLLKRKF
jgi:uncharacterized protein YydD (DUF2326 family)